MEADLKWLGMSHMFVLGTCWSKLFWIIFGNHAKVGRATFWKRNNVHRKKLMHYQESVCKKRELVRKFRDIFSSF
jgi:hypothetical protein